MKRAYLRTILQTTLMALTLLFVSSCSNESTQSAASDSTQTEGSTETGQGSVFIDAGPLVTSQLLQLLPYDDRDEDGIEDLYDPYPDTSPMLASPDSSNSLSTETVKTLIGQNRLSLVAMEGRRLYINGPGMERAAGQAQRWLVFHTPQGLRAKAAEYDPVLGLSAYPMADSYAVHVIIGNIRSHETSIRYLPQNAPALFDEPSTLQAGSSVELAGVNLDAVEHVMLGRQRLPVVTASYDRIRFELPQRPQANSLSTRHGELESNSIRLDIRRRVDITLDPSLTLQQGETLQLIHNMAKWPLGADHRLSIDLPAYRPVVLYFSIVNGNELVMPMILRAVVWPDQDSVQISVAGTLQARVVDQPALRHLIPDWRQLRAKLPLLDSLPSAQAYLNALRDVIDRIPVQTQPASLASVVADFHTAATSQPQISNPATGNLRSQPSLAKLTYLTGMDIAGVVGSVVEYATSRTDPAREIGVELLYPSEQNYGNRYAKYLVISHKANRSSNIVMQYLNSSCGFSPDERAPRGLNDSDICVQMDGITFASIAVYKPGDKAFDANYTLNEADRVRSHAKAEYNDKKMWGPGGHYLVDDQGNSLCNMEVCYVEIITSGYGPKRAGSLTTEQKKLVKKMRLRMWIEGIIPGLLSIAGIDYDKITGVGAVNVGGVDLGGANSVASAHSCLYKEIVGDGTIYVALENFATRLENMGSRSNSSLTSGVMDSFSQTVGQWMYDFMGRIKTQTFYDCVVKAAKPGAAMLSLSDVQTNIISTLKKNGMRELDIFTKIYSLVNLIGSAIFTPQHFVFRMEPRAIIHNVSPTTININSLSNISATDTFDIRGDFLATGPCNDPANWCPKLVFRDRLGNEFIYQIVESDIQYAGPFSSVASSLISIPYTKLAPGLSKLISGPIEMKLSVSDPDYTHYKDRKFSPATYGELPIPLRSGTLTLRSQSKLIGFRKGLLVPGETIQAIGSDLDVYKEGSRFFLVPVSYQSGNLSREVFRTGLTNFDPQTISLKLPDNMEPGEYFLKIEPAQSDTLDVLQSDARLVVRSAHDQAGIIVNDNGLHLDDTIRVEMLDQSKQLIQFGPDQKNLAMTIPGFNDALGIEEYVAGRYWNTLPVEYIRITCQASTMDDTCTFGIRADKRKVCDPGVGNVPVDSFSGKIPVNEKKIYAVIESGPCPPPDN